MRKKYVNKATYKVSAGKECKGQEMTVKGEAVKLRDLFDRMQAGIPLDVERDGSYTDSESFDDDDLEKLQKSDIFLKQEKIEQARQHLDAARLAISETDETQSTTKAKQSADDEGGEEKSEPSGDGKKSESKNKSE